jgi:hypothetical protein
MSSYKFLVTTAYDYDYPHMFSTPSDCVVYVRKLLEIWKTERTLEFKILVYQCDQLIDVNGFVYSFGEHFYSVDPIESFERRYSFNAKS